jgi:hypothetical protein
VKSYVVSFRLTERKDIPLSFKEIKLVVKDALADIDYDAKVSNIVVLPVPRSGSVTE